MNEALSMLSRRICGVTISVIFSPASEDGASALEWLAGQMTALYGPGAAPASHSAPQESRKRKPTNATSGPSSSTSSVPAGPMSSWESRLRQRLARIGSTECILTWKPSATPAGRPLSRLVPSMRPTAEIASGLWPTATSLAPAKDGNNEAGNSAGLVAIRKIAMSAWPTPTSRDHKDGVYCPNVKISGLLGRAVWATPTAHERTHTPRRVHHGEQLANQAAGLPPNGWPAEMGKPGALNPAFVCWLMGFPPEWESCAPTAMPSSRKSRRK